MLKFILRITLFLVCCFLSSCISNFNSNSDIFCWFFRAQHLQHDCSNRSYRSRQRLPPLHWQRRSEFSRWRNCAWKPQSYRDAERHSRRVRQLRRSSGFVCDWGDSRVLLDRDVRVFGLSCSCQLNCCNQAMH